MASRGLLLSCPSSQLGMVSARLAGCLASGRCAIQFEQRLTLGFLLTGWVLQISRYRKESVESGRFSGWAQVTQPAVGELGLEPGSAVCAPLQSHV